MREAVYTALVTEARSDRPAAKFAAYILDLEYDEEVE